MTIKEAIVKSLGDLEKITNSNEIVNSIIDNKYCEFGSTKNPSKSIYSALADMVKVGDTRIKRVKQNNGVYAYYLTKNEQNISFQILSSEEEVAPPVAVGKQSSYEERDLHALLSTYLKNTNIYSKTVYHEQSTFGKDSNQIWTHPDMIGVRFLTLHTKVSQNFLKAINRIDTFKVSSYEIKKEINTDSELKKAFFQAVSNSSWANYGYLVAFEISDNLTEELERLNQSFGIGVIKLNANPYQSKILFQAKSRTLDFKTIDKLCKINKDFENFIEQIEKLMTAEERYYKSTEKELDEFCDNYFTSDNEIENYCREKNIPSEQQR